jgi:hypothetical protein
VERGTWCKWRSLLGKVGVRDWGPRALEGWAYLTWTYQQST